MNLRLVRSISQWSLVLWLSPSVAGFSICERGYGHQNERHEGQESMAK